MKATQLEAVLRAAHATDITGGGVLALHRALREADPHGVYKPQAPQAPGLDLEETQDIPLRDCLRLPPLPIESGDAT